MKDSFEASSYQLHDTQKKIHLNASLVDFIDYDDGVILERILVEKVLAKKDTIRHVLNDCERRSAVFESDMVTNLQSTV